MTVHRVRLYHSTTGASSYHDWLSQWLNNVDAALQSEVDNEPPILREQTGSERDDYYMGDLAFHWNEGKAHILDNLDLYAASFCDWHRILYESCTHDEGDERESCSRDEKRENGTIPDYIEDLDSDQS